MLTIGVAACSGDSVAPAPVTPVATSIEIQDLGLVRDGDVVELSAVVKDQQQRPMPSIDVLFTVTDPTVASITGGRVLTALREGTTDIVAITGSGARAVQQRRTLSVVLHPATAIDVGTGRLDLQVHQHANVTATLRGLDNRLLTGRTLTWHSSNTGVAQVDAAGNVRAISPGAASITVRYGTLSRSVPVQVVAAGTRYPVLRINNITLPVVVYEEEITRDDGSTYTLIERLESGDVVVGDRYEVRLAVADIERYTLQGNVIERVMRRRIVRDDGLVYYNWLNGSAQLISTMVGGLSHTMTTVGQDLQLTFRLGGTNTIWNLSARLPQ
ncbi:Ig-like domain-containing protein [Gemmatimonas phototrophica]|uniref:BIG2 domain-containing protein n=1 Tax=Gemmatimonas phototrophica TaxID=1379270 RepID=A0A143BFT3_9BACT|nr:Ig-like domain-containing protein [Gemmatimonas phototrophica]AMW03869.1 hypothetical protein GEMMAAP_01450 [Gemmatimonas phototrophica]